MTTGDSGVRSSWASMARNSFLRRSASSSSRFSRRRSSASQRWRSAPSWRSCSRRSCSRSELGLARELGGAAAQLDEHGDLGAQHLGHDRLEQEVDRAELVAAQDALLILAIRGDEDDRRVPAAPARCGPGARSRSRPSSASGCRAGSARSPGGRSARSASSPARTLTSEPARSPSAASIASRLFGLSSTTRMSPAPLSAGSIGSVGSEVGIRRGWRRFRSDRGSRSEARGRRSSPRGHAVVRWPCHHRRRWSSLSRAGVHHQRVTHPALHVTHPRTNAWRTTRSRPARTTIRPLLVWTDGPFWLRCVRCAGATSRFVSRRNWAESTARSARPSMTSRSRHRRWRRMSSRCASPSAARAAPASGCAAAPPAADGKWSTPASTSSSTTSRSTPPIWRASPTR